MKPYIKLNLEHGYSEDALCDRFGITHMRYRREHPSPDDKLSEGTMYEIQKGSSRDIPALAKKYLTTEAQVRRAIRDQPNLHGYVDRAMVRKYHADGLDHDAIARVMRISVNQVKVALRKPRDNKKREQVRELLKTMTQVEIAEYLGMCQSSVSYYCDEGVKRKNRPKLKLHEWDKLIAEYKTGNITISELSTRYNVSRATIYRRIKLL